MESGYVISDLHMFTQRTVAPSYQDAINRAAGEADFFVLNGDVFDFRWTTLNDAEHTACVAVEWLESLAKASPNCRFFYIMGNHDGLDFFAEHLKTTAERIENFEWHSSHLRIGSSLFFHGDLPLGIGRPDAFERTLLPIERKKGKLANFAYHLFIESRLHRLTAHFHSAQRCAKRIHAAMKQDATGLTEGITDVYFGHIHHTFTDFKYNGFTFHNTGSAIRHLKCNLLQVRP
ncbi:MAG: metallophosphoesterase [Phycisphaerae bacterium]|nr:metallophosphoesterase [Phycisphaerae bacterium]